ncbi:MAG: tyrosine-protein phosphatase [Chloroflexota bacterium]|nr:tyrosine-protein phosphatase [Chloroflexota bacterium]
MPAPARDRGDEVVLDRHIRLAGTRNLRDVGGYPAAGGRRTRWRMLLRTDALDRLPAASQATLLDLGLRQVIDLRWPSELDEAPSVFRASDAVNYRNIALLDEDPGPGKSMADIYRLMLDVRAPQLVEVVRSLLAPGGLPAVVGCAAGKDRTGVAIALVLAAVGVPADVVAIDYALSAEIFAADVADEHLIDWRAAPAIVDCTPETMLEALDHLERRHGGAAALLRRNGVTDDELVRLRDLLTEPDPADAA